jgi:hypothetical protein
MMIPDYCLSALLNLSSRIGCYLFCGFICTAFSYSKWLPFYINVLSIKTAEESPCSNPVSSAPIRASRSMRCCASTINKLNLFFECGIPMPQDAGTHLLAQLQFFKNPFIILIAVLENLPTDAGLHKRATFSTRNVGRARTGNQTRTTCVASSGTNRSTFHYAF